LNCHSVWIPLYRGVVFQESLTVFFSDADAPYPCADDAIYLELIALRLDFVTDRLGPSQTAQHESSDRLHVPELDGGLEPVDDRRVWNAPVEYVAAVISLLRYRHRIVSFELVTTVSDEHLDGIFHSRDGVKDGRSQRPVFLWDHIDDGIAALIAKMDAEFGEDVSRIEVTEAAMAVAEENPERVHEKLDEWGYGWA